MMTRIVVPFLLISAGVSHAADFATGQAARLVIGQHTFTAQDAAQTYAGGTIAFSGGIQANDQITVTVATAKYTYTVVATDTLTTIANNLATVMNNSNGGKGDPNVTTTVNAPNNNVLVLTALTAGPTGSTITFSASVSSNAQVVATPSGSTLTGGQIANANTLGGVGGIAYVNGRLIAADANRIGATPINNRVLIYDTTTLPKPLDLINRDASPNIRCPVCVGTAMTVLGQPNFATTDPAITASNMRTPVAVATDGVRLAVADTDNNRVLIWNTIPTTNGAPADLVLGQPNFTSVAIARPPNSQSLLGPQGVWFQGGKLFVADTLNNRVLIWNSIPASNAQAADVVLGQPNFTTNIEANLTQTVTAAANNLLSPVSVTSDGQRLYVSDLGNNRVLIWKSIPTTNQQPSDIAIGQPDLLSSSSNNAFTVSTTLVESPVLCTVSNGVDVNNNPTYPGLCASTLSFPRYALSDGKWLFIADAGNDRVLVYRSVPTANGAAADLVLGQYSDSINAASDDATNGNPLRRSSADSVRTPMSLAWDGTNLFVSDPFNRRVLGFTLADQDIPFAGIRNAASLAVYSSGTLTLSGTITAGDVLTVNIAVGQGATGTDYSYTVVANDTLATIVTNMVGVINSSNSGAGDPNVIATANLVSDTIVMTARVEGNGANNIFFTFKTSSTATVASAASNANLEGGQDAAQLAPGALIAILGNNFTDQTASADTNATDLPTVLGGVRVYVDGIPAPLLYVSPTQVNAQIPWETLDASGLSAYIRAEWSDGHVSATNASAIVLVTQYPGLFALGGQDPRLAVALHYSDSATGTISVDGSAYAGDVGQITINGRNYTYTVLATDTLASIRDAFINLINQDPDVEAYAAGLFTRIRLRARQTGAAGNGIPYSASTTTGVNIVLTATTSQLCCANIAYSPVTVENPAMAGETIVVYATGLGMITTGQGLTPDPAVQALVDGEKYAGPDPNQPVVDVSSLAGNVTANVLYASLKPGMVGVYELQLQLDSSLTTNAITELVLAQGSVASNVVTVPVFAGGTGTISASPNPCNVDKTGFCSVTITWQASGSGLTTTTVYVAHGGTEEQFSDAVLTGTQVASWITATGGPYVFNLYDTSSGSKGALLASVSVTGVTPSP